MTPDEAVEAVKIIEELAMREGRDVVKIWAPLESPQIPEQKDWAVKVRLGQCFKEYFGPTLLSALRAAKEGA